MLSLLLLWNSNTQDRRAERTPRDLKPPIVRVVFDGGRLVQVSLRERLYKREGPIDAVSLPLTSVLSILTTVMISQLAASSRLHSVYERCARWLLLSEERLQLTEIPLTQGYLAMMHAPNRSGLTLAAPRCGRPNLSAIATEELRFSRASPPRPESLFNFWTRESNQANVPQIIRQSFVDLKMVSQFALWRRKAFDDQERVGRVTAIAEERWKTAQTERPDRREVLRADSRRW